MGRRRDLRIVGEAGLTDTGVSMIGGQVSEGEGMERVVLETSVDTVNKGSNFFIDFILFPKFLVL